MSCNCSAGTAASDYPLPGMAKAAFQQVTAGPKHTVCNLRSSGRAAPAGTPAGQRRRDAPVPGPTSAEPRLRGNRAWLGQASGSWMAQDRERGAAALPGSQASGHQVQTASGGAARQAGLLRGCSGDAAVSAQRLV